MVKTYTVKKINCDITDFSAANHWINILSEKIDYYLWTNNSYEPQVNAKMMYSNNYLYVFFKVYEEKIRVRHTGFGSDVWKDSCVELFINPFPEKSNDYINIEINAIGAMLIAKGKNRNSRSNFSKDDVKDFTIISSVKEPVDGKYGAEYWTLYYKLPLTFFEKAYNEAFSGGNAIANFYKCGDETEFPHYGAWNNIPSDNPDFHQPRYFGELIFE